MSVLSLNKLLNLSLGWWDIHRMCSVVATNEHAYYLKFRNKDQQLIMALPNSARGEGRDYLIITRNWKPRNSEGVLVDVQVLHVYRSPC